MTESEIPRTAKERLRDLLDRLPDDLSFEDLIREMAFRRTVDRGLADLERGRTRDTDEIARRMAEWRV